MTSSSSSSIHPTVEPDAQTEPAASAERTRVHAFILLGGGLSPSPLTAATKCSVLDLLIGPGDQTVLDRWMSEADRLRGLTQDRMPIIIATGGGVPPPTVAHLQGRREVQLIVDRQAYRGAAGVVCDVSSHLPDDALLLIAEAARSPDFDLAAAIRHHESDALDATVIVNPDGTPAGAYVIARHLLRFVQREGYMDLKEQWLQKVVDSDHRVGAYRIDGGYSRPLRTREQLLLAARRAARRTTDSSEPLRFAMAAHEASAEGFACFAPGASVHPSAVVVDSIVLDGAVIGAGSIVTRSIVCKDARVANHAQVIDTIFWQPAGKAGPAHANGTHREPDA